MGIISQPDWKDENSISIFGEPRLGFLVSSGNMDSMVNHYTVAKKHRKTDAFTPGGVMGKRPDRSRTESLIRQFQLEGLEKKIPGQLSGGQKQRIAIAGVLAMEPECIVLDEATAMLDPAGRREVLDTVHRLNRQRGITVVHITHHMSEAEDADRVIVMNDGVVAMDGTPRDIFSRVEELRSLGLAAPDTVELLHRLNGHGMSLPLTAITVDECARAIFQALHGAEGK